MGKSVVLLGGSAYQTVAIRRAKEFGLSTILFDANENCPGRKFADEFYPISTNDCDSIIKEVKRHKVHGIVCYESDQSIESASWVCERLGLPGQPYESVKILQNKALFRNYLREHGFIVPNAKGYNNIDTALRDLNRFSFPVVVKPVDSCGSKGVSIVKEKEDIAAAILEALKYSHIKSFIIEEFVEKYGYQIAGDGFSVDGELVFRCFANEHFDESGTNKISPIGESFPYVMPYEIHDKIHDTVQRLLRLLNMRTGAYNFDIRLNNKQDVVIMEVSPRNGGCLIPEVTRYATGVDEVGYTIRAALGEDCSKLTMVQPEGYWSSYIIHGYEKGVIRGYDISEELKKNNLVETRIFRNIGELAPGFDVTDWVCGAMILKYSSRDEMLYKMDHMQDYVKVVVKND